MSESTVDRSTLCVSHTVLVAEDEPDLLKLLVRRLGKSGYQVIVASDGEQALQRTQELLPDIVVLDMMMPKMTGLDVALRLRAGSATQHIPIVLISAGFQTNDDPDITLSGVSRLRKPFGAAALSDLLAEILAA